MSDILSLSKTNNELIHYKYFFASLQMFQRCDIIQMTEGAALVQ